MGKEIYAIFPNISQVKTTIINDEIIVFIHFACNLFIKIIQNKNEPIKNPKIFTIVGYRKIDITKIKKLYNSYLLINISSTILCSRYTLFLGSRLKIIKHIPYNNNNNPIIEGKKLGPGTIFSPIRTFGKVRLYKIIKVPRTERSAPKKTFLKDICDLLSILHSILKYAPFRTGHFHFPTIPLYILLIRVLSSKFGLVLWQISRILRN